ncbi:iron-sulfur cluster assembly accessory protein [Arthrospira platensis NIES-39]|nr:iron-sulfur cluster assembly accessory protein [Arthrospira platensis NIES-39]
MLYVLNMIHLTQSATNEVLRQQSRKNDSNLLFRLGVKSGGCCEWVYTFGWEPEATANDGVYQCGSIRIVIDSEIAPYLAGLTLDYSEDLMGGGFRFDNPNAAKTCSCGHSFVFKS